MKHSGKLMQEAEQIAATVESWADLANALYNPTNGLLTTAYPTKAKRKAFAKTPTYGKIRQLLRDAMDRFGLVEGATPKKSGRFVVRLPQSLHFALEREARQEGVSLNQLVTTKLAVQLRDVIAS